jgi:hypothetical protein
MRSRARPPESGLETDRLLVLVAVVVTAAAMACASRRCLIPPHAEGAFASR